MNRLNDPDSYGTRLWTPILGLALLLGCSLPLLAAESYRIEARPSWVAPVEAGVVKQELLNQAADGVYYLLS
ncbi:MAG: hypothetical protein KDI60_17990, partial [Xanthomonadales bacterium]|nr:hypothetical protein [Xanthomonadales bacterium]